MENQLFKKLQIKVGFSVNLFNAPDNVLAILGETSTLQVYFNHLQSTDAILIFANTNALLTEALQQLKQIITDKTVCWVCYPKTKSGLSTDLNLMQNWENLKAFQLSPCASASINDIWTSIRIKPEASLKKSGKANADIQQNEYAKYIDVQSKTVILPDDLGKELAKHPTALTFYQQLSYSNKKEYVIWILSAKQEKTRQERVEKAVAKLLAGKKNPTEK